MRILYLGDIVGRSGREAVLRRLPEVLDRVAPDFVIANGENAAGGFGITRKIWLELFSAGIDVITTGNHVWDQREIILEIDAEPRVLRPLNYQAGTPGRGAGAFPTRDGRQVVVINVMGRLFMELLDDPFAALEAELGRNRLGQSCAAIVVDVHAEATSEKMAMGHAADGRASLVVGSHTHIPTADVMLLEGGTAYQSDAGMCGDYDSVIGMKKEVATEKFRRKLVDRLTPADGEGTVCGVAVDTNDATGLAVAAHAVRVGPRLAEAWPPPKRAAPTAGAAE